MLSFVHCVEDSLKQNFPLNPYHERLFEARCVNYDGRIELVRFGRVRWKKESALGADDTL